MKAILRSSDLVVTVNSHGAEICSVKNSEGTEFIWQAKKEVWARHAPVLFPIVGKLKEDKYFFDGEFFSLPQHGFARDMEFSLQHADDEQCQFTLSATEETFAKYPFDFQLEIIHSLSKNTLTTKYKVKNNSEGAMFFSIGAHPAFNCPLNADEKFEDYYLEFETQSLERTLLRDGLISNEKIILSLENKKIFLSPSLFDQDALVFENAQINSISLASIKSKHRISMNCSKWPFFGIWSKKGSRNFVCLEPWYGIADGTEHDQKLIRKKGIIVLPATETFSCSFSVSFS